MKKLKYSILALIAAFALVQFSACTEDDTSDDPQPEDPREKLLGTWTVDESCVRLDYEVEITADANSDTKIYIQNFAFTGPDYDPAHGYVDGNTINLPQQIIGDNWTIQGAGTYLPDNTIFWEYYIEIGANASNCEAEYE